MFTKENKLTKSAFILLGIFFAVHLVLRLYAIASLPPSTDEPDDMFTVKNDISKISTFFDHAYAPDQSRLPFVVSAPLLKTLGDHQALFFLRLLFLTFHFLYLWISYKLTFLVTKNHRAALLYVLLLLSSCYLAGFSIFAITTAGWLYALFHVLVIYFFWKSFLQQSENGIFKGYIPLSILIGLCIASKLFGVFLLPSLIVFHWFIHRNKTISIQGEKVSKLLFSNMVFLLSLTVINFIPLTGFVKLVLALFLSALYCAGLAYFLLREKTDTRISNINPLAFWITISLTAFCMAIIFSPIYLNLSNISNTLNWFFKWPTGAFIEKHGIFDILIILVIKFGWISLVPGLGLFLASLKNPPGSRQGFGLLISLVFLVHFIVVSSVRFICTWYPLVIFPFLYLPVVFFYDHVQRTDLKNLKKVCSVILCVIFLDNAARYGYWFPYAHFDGAQYGKQHIGWNKSAMVSFEWFPQAISFLQALDPSKTHTINVQACYVPSYNRWVIRLLNKRLISLGIHHVSLVEKPLGQNEGLDYIFSSPVYNPDLESRLEFQGYRRVRMISLKGIDMISVWNSQ